MNTLEVSGNSGEVLKWYIPVYFIVYLKFRTLQIAFYVHYTTREICIKLTTLVCGWCKAILENQTVKNESYYCAFQIFHFFFLPVLYVSRVIHVSSVRHMVHYRPKVWNILKPNGNTRTWHFDLLETTWHQPSIVTLTHFSCIMLGVKNTTCNVRN